MQHDHGIEHTTVVENVGDIELRRCKGIANVVWMYDAGVGRSVYGNGGANQVVFGFYFDEFGYWFAKKSDALFAAQWVRDTNWDGKGDLEMFVEGAMGTKENGFRELGKIHF